MRLPGGGMAERVRATDWSRTPLGPAEAWPEALRVAVGICLNSKFPMFVWWGPDLVNIYNDAYAPVLGKRHPAALGMGAREIWADIWPQIGEDVERVMRGEPVSKERARFVMERNGYPEVTYFSYSHSPIPDGRGGIGGLFQVCTDETQRVLAERERDRLAEQRQFALDAARMGWWHYDPATDVATYDARFAEIFDLTGDARPNPEILGRIHPEDLPAVLAAVTAALDPARATGFAAEYRVVRGDGAVRWVRGHGVTHVEGDGEARRATSFVGTVADVTDQRLAEEALRESEARFRHLADAMPQMVFAATADGHVDYFNQRWYEYTGLPEGSVGFESWKHVHTDEGLRRVTETWPEALRTGRPYEIEYQLRRHDGEYRWHLGRALPIRDAAGRIVRWFGTNTDIHDQKRATELLRDATARAERNAGELEALIEAMPHAIYFGNESGITRCNGRALEMLGASSLDDLKARIAELGERFKVSYRDEPDRLVAPADLPFARALRGEVASLDTWVTRLDGGGRTCVRGTSAPVSEGGTIVGAVAVNTDITDQVRGEEALREARDAAEAANRAKDRFLAALSHELRTPLTPVAMAATAMEMDPRLPYDLRDDAAMIRRNVELETRLIDDLLDLSRVISGKLRLHRQPTHVNGVVRHVLETVGADLHEKRLTVETDLAATNDRVEADQARLQQAIWNILKNAAKFTPAGGRVTIRTWNEAGHWSVEVRDTGKGIAPDLLARVFDPFEQGDASVTRQYGGMGLGLAIARGVVDLHGGTIRVASEGEGRGAAFTVTLPLLAPAAPPTRTLGAEPAAPGDGRPLRLLLVEDHADTARTLVRLLQLDGLEVRWAGSVADALKAADEWTFDLVVSDLGLPDGSGCDLMRQLRRNQTVPGIAMSGYGMDEDIRMSREAGFSEHLAKPVNVPQLRQAIHRVVSGGGAK